jgi:5-methylcytosine-specific restriction enzyme A
MPKRPPTFRPKGQSRAEQQKRYDTQRKSKPDGNFYSSRGWRQFRASYMARHPNCVRCQAKGTVTPATQLHHRIPRKQSPELTYVESNLEALCTPCHSRHEAGITWHGKQQR